MQFSALYRSLCKKHRKIKLWIWEASIQTPHWCCMTALDPFFCCILNLFLLISQLHPYIPWQFHCTLPCRHILPRKHFIPCVKALRKSHQLVILTGFQFPALVNTSRSIYRRKIQNVCNPQVYLFRRILLLASLLGSRDAFLAPVWHFHLFVHSSHSKDWNQIRWLQSRI